MTLPVVPQEAIESAAQLLLEARLALVYGLVSSTVEAQREATRIADLLRGVIDSAASPGHHGTQAAFEREGSLTASLGEVKRRANLVVFWGCDPDRLLPGFVDRYAPARAGRLRISVDVGEELGPDRVDERVALPPGREMEALLALRAFVRGRRVEADRAVALGLPLAPLRRLARQIAACGYGALLSDADPRPDRRDPERAGALGALARDARGKARVRVVGVRRPGNAVGAENVLTWQTGFPGAISFASGAPRYGPGEFTGEAVLARGEVDAGLVVGAEPAQFLSAPALQTLARLPTVFVGSADARDSEPASVGVARPDGSVRHATPDGLVELASPPGAARSTTAPRSIRIGRAPGSVRIATAPFEATTGHVFRMDGVALRQRPAGREPPSGTAGGAALPTEAEVLRQIAEAIAKRLDAVPERRARNDGRSAHRRGERP